MLINFFFSLLDKDFRSANKFSKKNNKYTITKNKLRFLIDYM